MTRSRMPRRFCRPGTIALLSLLFALTATAKNVDDVVVLKNGDRMTGEIKGLQRGELRFKADYMAESVRLDWARVQSIESKTTFMIWLVDGKLVTTEDYTNIKTGMTLNPDLWVPEKWTTVDQNYWH